MRILSGHSLETDHDREVSVPRGSTLQLFVAFLFPTDHGPLGYNIDSSEIES